MNTSCRRRLPALLLAVLLVLLAFAACGTDEPEVNPDIVEEPSVSSQPEPIGILFANPLPIPTAASSQGILDTGLVLAAKEKDEENSDTVGWLQVPDTTIDDVILWYPGDRNKYYLRRDFDKVENTGPLATQYGSYFADYRCTFDGGRNGLSRNTVIYGHSMEDNPYGQGFSPLKRFLAEDFAKATPYIYFSTTDEDMAWEVFAVFYSTIDLPYNRPNMTDDDFKTIIDECLKRSIYNYDAVVSAEDKILTLSTCCYNFTTAYPNNYRYVVMAKLVKPGQRLNKEAAFTVNPSPKAP